MEELALISLEETISIAYRACEDGVRRWRDLDIAEWLGFSEIYQIRQLISRNLPELPNPHQITRLLSPKLDSPGTKTGAADLLFAFYQGRASS